MLAGFQHQLIPGERGRGCLHSEAPGQGQSPNSIVEAFLSELSVAFLEGPPVEVQDAPALPQVGWAGASFDRAGHCLFVNIIGIRHVYEGPGSLTTCRASS